MRITIILQRQGWKVNHKKVYRIYKEEGLQVRTKKRKKSASKRRTGLPRPKRINKIWSMDFVHDRLVNQRKLRMLTIVDHFSRESVGIEVKHSLKVKEVIRTLMRLKHERAWPSQMC